MNTGEQELYKTAFIEATKVSVGTITSSPEETPANFKLICNADVPELHAIAYLEPVYLEIAFSN